MFYVPGLGRRVFGLLPHEKLSPIPISISSSLVQWLNTIHHFSSSNDHNGSIRGPITESDEIFHFDDNRSNSRIPQHSSEPIPNRPLRSGNQFSQSPDYREFSRGYRPVTPRSDNHGRLGNEEKTNISAQTDAQFRSRNVETNRETNKLEDSFLDKFKLGFNNKRVNGSEVADSNQLKEEKWSSPAQTDPETIPQDADEIFKKMKETGLIPNAVAMLDGLCKDGLVQEAMKLFGLMREKGTIPEVVIYTAVVEGYTKAHKADDAQRIFRKMQNNGISPNAFSYTVLIQGLCKCNRWEDAVEFCVEMLEAGHSPNLMTFVGLVDIICREKGVAEAQGFIRTLSQKGFNLDEKAVREFLDKKAPFSSSVWEAIFGKKTPQRPF